MTDVVTSGCDRPKIYKVVFDWEDKRKEGAYLDLRQIGHFDSPNLSVKDPYIGPLCEHELIFLRHESTDVAYNIQWAFELTEIGYNNKYYITTVKNLLKLYMDKAPFPDESATALSKAKEITKKYNFTREDLGIKDYFGELLEI